MFRLRYQSAVLVMIMLILSGCSSCLANNVLRIVFLSDGKRASYKLNRDESVSIRNSKITNVVEQLGLQQGDIILISKPNPEMGVSGDSLRWLARFGARQKVALYVHPELGTKDSITTIPIYHWQVPYSTPRDLAKASFFFEGKKLGSGSEGFERMLQHIKGRKSHHIFILGSLYDQNEAFGPLETPYGSKRKQLEDVLNECGTKQLLPSQVPAY